VLKLLGFKDYEQKVRPGKEDIELSAKLEKQ
jgi:hypothetical protein